jgi:hypothetical protein
MKIGRLKPRIATLGTDPRIGTTPQAKRKRGRALQAENRRLLRDNPWCVDCAAEGVQRVVDEWDHDVSLAAGGPESPENKVGRCFEHHAAKSAREAAERAGKGEGGPS